MVKNRKKELLDLARKLFIEKGYDNVSIDEIIKKAKMAKGTFYYYFKSKDELLDVVINDMIERKIESAKEYVDAEIPVEKKFIEIITSLSNDDTGLIKALSQDGNAKMHVKYSEQIIVAATSLLKKVVNEGNKKAIFHCNHVEERIRMILILGSKLFEDQNYTENDIDVFIDIVEKTLGAKKGTMNFVKDRVK